MDDGMNQREWQYRVTRLGIAGTAQLLMEQDDGIAQLRAEIERLHAIIAASNEAAQMYTLLQEVERLRGLLAGGNSVVIGPFMSPGE